MNQSFQLGGEVLDLTGGAEPAHDRADLWRGGIDALGVSLEKSQIAGRI